MTNFSNQPFSTDSLGFVKTDSTFLSATWSYFGIAILVAALGAWSAPAILTVLPFMVLYIAFFGLMLTQGMWGNSKTFAVPGFFIFAFLSGAILFPTLAFASLNGMIGVVVQALLVSAAVFFSAAAFGFSTKKDLSSWGQFLFMTMMGLFITGISSMVLSFFGLGFLQFGSTLGLIFSGISVVLFSAYTCYDMQNIKKGLYDSPLTAAFHLYFNMFAIFQNLLHIFLSFNQD